MRFSLIARIVEGALVLERLSLVLRLGMQIYLLHLIALNSITTTLLFCEVKEVKPRDITKIKHVLEK